MLYMYVNLEIFFVNGVGWSKGEFLLVWGWGLRFYFLVILFCELKKVLNFLGGLNFFDFF